MPFIETIDPQAFIDALQTTHPIDFYAEHDSEKLLATTVNHSLALRADNQGLHMEATIIDTNIGRDTYQMIKAGVISSMSFGFVVLDDDWDYNKDIPFRTVRSLELYEVSAVRFPAYLDSTIATRGKQELQKLESRGYTSVSNTVTIKDKEKGGNELDLRDFSTKDLFDEIQKRFAKEDVKPENEEARADEKPKVEPKEEKREALDGNTLAQQISDAILGKISDLVGVKETKRDDEPVDDTSADTSTDEPVPDDAETDSADTKPKEKEEARDDESDEPDDTSDDSADTSDADTSDADTSDADTSDADTSDDNEPDDAETDSADKPKSSEKRSLLKEMEDIFKDEN